MDLEKLRQLEDRPKAGVVGTPVEVVNEMLDRLPQGVFKSSTTTFLDPHFGRGTFLVEIIKRLKEYGHTKQNIQKRVFGIEIRRGAFNRTSRELSQLNLQLFNEDSLTKDFNSMKFDVVIGNPPYQKHDAKAYKLWPKFLDLALDLSEGYVGFVTPDVWIKGRNATAKKARKLITGYQVTFLDKTANNYFNVGESICSYILKKAPNTEPTLYRDGKRKEYVTLTEAPLLFDPEEILIEGILQKVEKSYHPRVQIKGVVNGNYLKREKEFSVTPKQGYNTILIDSHKNTFYSSNMYPEVGVPKLIINNSGYYYSTTNGKYLRKGLEEVAGNNAFMVLMDSIEERDLAYQVFTSKLFRFFIEKDKTSGFNGRSLVKLPVVDYTRNWSDKELYKHFNLTQEEIELVEISVA